MTLFVDSFIIHDDLAMYIFIDVTDKNWTNDASHHLLIAQGSTVTGKKHCKNL